MSSALLEVERSHGRHSRRRKGRSPRSMTVLRHRPRRDLGHRRRIRLRQIGHQPCRDGPDRRSGPRHGQGASACTAKDGGVRDLSRLPEAAMRRVRGDEIAMIFQEPMTSLNPVYTIGEQIIEAIRFHRDDRRRRAARARAEEMLELARHSRAAPTARRLSAPALGGMRQRAMIAHGARLPTRALLIADEPTTALDVTVQAQILELLRGLQREFGMAMIFITHNLGVVAEIADRVMVMYAGRVVETGSARADLRGPAMPYTHGPAALGAAPRARPRRDGPLPAIPGNVPDLRAPAERLPLPSALRLRSSPACATRRCRRSKPAATAHHVRCLRWREIASDDAPLARGPRADDQHFSRGLLRRPRCERSTDVSFEIGAARCSAWSANRARARPRSAARCCACIEPTAGQHPLSTATISRELPDSAR